MRDNPELYPSEVEKLTNVFLENFVAVTGDVLEESTKTYRKFSDNPEILDEQLYKLFKTNTGDNVKEFIGEILGQPKPKIVHPHPKKLEKIAKVFGETFYKKIQDVIKGQADPVQMAAWTHQQIAKTHFFGDANGRVARLWQNMVLQLGGRKAVIFPSSELYYKAIFDGNYEEYLRKIISWNEKNEHMMTS